MANNKELKRKQLPQARSFVPLGREAKRVLSSVFKVAESERSGVDVDAYRAKRVRQRDMRAGCAGALGYLRTEVNTSKYFVSLIGTVATLSGFLKPRGECCMESKLEEIREWAKTKIASGAEPPWSWYQYMKLIETLDAILGG